MLTAPYVRSLDHPVINVSCFEWRSHQGVNQFCPELNLTVTGATREDVADRMRDALQQRCAEGIALGSIGDELIVRHMVHS